ncbi:MAG: hypothetical protein LAO24_02780 [Acidobacteriia bacterium]|nr:hypothetical protein [Terriglobia bacterium]
MPDQRPAASGLPPAGPASPSPSVPAPASTQSGPTINIADEFGTAKRNLPPAKIVLIAIAGVLVVVAVASFLKRATPQGAGSLDNVAAIEIPGQSSTMVALTFTLRNTGEKTLYVRSIQGRLTAASGESSGDAVSAVDFDRYFQAFPALKAGAQPALSPETKLQPGEQVTRTAIVVFPVTMDSFNQRKSLSVVIQPYDQQVPVVLTK